MFLCSFEPMFLRASKLWASSICLSTGCVLCFSPVVNGCKESRENSRKLVGKPGRGVLRMRWNWVAKE